MPNLAKVSVGCGEVLEEHRVHHKWTWIFIGWHWTWCFERYYTVYYLWTHWLSAYELPLNIHMFIKINVCMNMNKCRCINIHIPYNKYLHAYYVWMYIWKYITEYSPSCIFVRYFDLVSQLIKGHHHFNFQVFELFSPFFVFFKSVFGQKHALMFSKKTCTYTQRWLGINTPWSF